MSRDGRDYYPPRLRWFVAATLALAAPAVAGAAAVIPFEPPSAPTGGAVALFFALALLADLKPVPLDETGERSVSLAFVFVLATQLLFGWRYAVLVAVTSVFFPQLVERRPMVRTLFNSAVYALSAFASGLPPLVLGLHTDLHIGHLMLSSFLGGAAYVLVNVVLVCTAVAFYQGTAVRPLLHDNVRHSGTAFVVMAFLAALTTALWKTEPQLIVLLAGPLFTLTLYQRSALASKVATRDALTDNLTKLGNHRSYELDLREFLNRATEDGTDVVLCLVDVDEFKLINDLYGHPLGDEVLIRLARSFAEGGDGAHVYRFGGDEFALIFEGGKDAAYQHVETVRRRIAKTRFAHGQTVTISVGLGSFPKHARSADELQRVSDAALYWAKRHGKNRACVYNPSVVRLYSPEELARRAEHQARLRAAENLVRVVDTKDTYTGDHSDAVSQLVREIARELGLSDETVSQLTLAGLLHDVGKIAIPDHILQKPSALSPEEFRLIRGHPELGASLLEGLDISPIDTWIRHHHEHWDGSGYPLGLAGEDIPLGSRIILVADAFHAMTSERSYRHAATVEAAVTELARMARRQFDPEVVRALVACLGHVELVPEPPSLLKLTA